MDCRQFREVLDCYVDGELSAESATAAEAHRRECARCGRVTAQLLRLRSDVKQAVRLHAVPPDLEQRVRTALRPRWLPRWEPVASRPRLVAVGALIVLVLGVLSLTVAGRPLIGGAAATLDRIAVLLDESRTAVVQATVLCRDCELEHRYGIKADCKVVGHHGAIVSADGRIWNIIEQRSSSNLIHDNALLGAKVRVSARFFRRAGAVEVQSYWVDAGTRAITQAAPESTHGVRLHVAAAQPAPLELVRHDIVRHNIGAGTLDAGNRATPRNIR